MSATEELRRLLDEAGVEWEDASPVPSMKQWKTSFTSFTGEEVTISAYDEPKWLMGTMVFLTPEQAIAATLGRGTCHNTQLAEMDEKAEKKHRRAIASVLYGGIFPEDEPVEFTCSACGKTALIDWVTLYDIRFCPFCGAKVVVP